MSHVCLGYSIFSQWMHFKYQYNLVGYYVYVTEGLNDPDFLDVPYCLLPRSLSAAHPVASHVVTADGHQWDVAQH